jgi:hypothetical protein
MINEVVGAIINRRAVSTDHREIQASAALGRHVELITRPQAAHRALLADVPIWRMLAQAPTLFLVDQGIRYAAFCVWTSVAIALLAQPGQAADADFVNALTIPGESQDLWPGTTPHDNRFAFGSDLVFDPLTDLYYGLVDSGPEGEEPFVARLQQLSLHVDPTTGAISDFQLIRTIPFKTSDGSATFDGRPPGIGHGDSQMLGLSLDPEGLALGQPGTLFIADEYGPSVHEFALVDNAGHLEARLARSFAVPENLIPQDTTGSINYTATRSTDPAQATGRQSGRGYEGLAITPDGNTLLAILQDPLHEEGNRNDGRRSRNLRIVRFDVPTGASTGQFVYQVEDIVDINERVPSAPFTTTNQGRNVGVSAITAIDDQRFLVLERDGRGWDVENAALSDPVLNAAAIKRVYQIDIAGATDVSQTSFAGSSTLPAGVVPVSKRLLFDIQADLEYAGLTIPSKLEGLAIGPRLADGQYSLIISSDNDFSTLEIVDPTGTDPPQFTDVYTDGTTGPIGGDPMGRSLLPLFVMGFRAPSLIAFNGDLDNDGTLDVDDVNQLLVEIASGANNTTFDLTTDRRVDRLDLRYWVHDLARTWIGDANLDRSFGSADLTLVSQAGKYETGRTALWNEGDWTADGRFTTSDLVAAFQDGGYEQGARPAFALVPEPSGTAWLAAILSGCFLGDRRRQRASVRSFGDHPRT